MPSLCGITSLQQTGELSPICIQHVDLFPWPNLYHHRPESFGSPGSSTDLAMPPMPMSDMLHGDTNFQKGFRSNKEFDRDLGPEFVRD